MFKEMYSHSVIASNGCCFFILIGLVFFPVSALADEALMQPVQDIHFQELPPPWESQPVPKIVTPVAKPKPTKWVKPIQSKPSKKPVTPVVKQVVESKANIKSQTAKPSAALIKRSAPKHTTVQSLMAAAKQNDSQAQYDLGMRYQYGNGVQKSRSAAHRWLSKSAESGHARAQYALSMFYQQYARNQQGAKKALLWLKRAADQDLVDAQYSLGMMFKNGSLVYANPAESRKWLKMAASKGHVLAQLALK